MLIATSLNLDSINLAKIPRPIQTTSKSNGDADLKKSKIYS